MTTQVVGEITTTKDFNSKFKLSSRDMMLTEQELLKGKNSSMHTKIFVSKWEWHHPITIKKFGRLFNKLIKIEMEKLTNKK